MKLDAIGREQLAAQVVAIMRAIFCRPEAKEMREVLRLAEQQITAEEEHPASTFQASTQ
jgi:hypothetical protein